MTTVRLLDTRLTAEEQASYFRWVQEVAQEYAARDEILWFILGC
jgi:hypothetical protein